MKKDRGDFRLRKDISQKRYVISAIVTFVVTYIIFKPTDVLEHE